MSEFNNVTVIKQANIYFDGQVTSRSIVFPDGSTKTLGIMLPGEYIFNTDAKELMEIIDGELEVLLPDNDKWQTFKSGESFEVPEQSRFGVKAKKITDYCCSFLS